MTREAFEKKLVWVAQKQQQTFFAIYNNKIRKTFVCDGFSLKNNETSTSLQWLYRTHASLPPHFQPRLCFFYNMNGKIMCNCMKRGSFLAFRSLFKLFRMLLENRRANLRRVLDWQLALWRFFELVSSTLKASPFYFFVKRYTFFFFRVSAVRR